MKTPGRLREEVSREIISRGLWNAGDSVGVAVSGGIDSVVLLDILAHTRGRHGAKLTVLTVDHAQRKNSQIEADWVMTLADKYQIPARSMRLDATPDASEAILREGRYRWFDQQPETVIALGHHLNDQAETALLQIIRGAGFAGQRGMRWKRGRYARPLLAVSKTQLIEYAKSLSLGWHEDPSNQSPTYTRNRIRHEVLPLLEAIRPGAQKAIARSASHANEEAEALDLLAAQWLAGRGPDFTVADVTAQPKALVRRALLALYPTLKATQLDDLFACISRGHGEVRLNTTEVLKVNKGRLTLSNMV